EVLSVQGVRLALPLLPQLLADVEYQLVDHGFFPLPCRSRLSSSVRRRSLLVSSRCTSACSWFSCRLCSSAARWRPCRIASILVIKVTVGVVRVSLPLQPLDEVVGVVLAGQVGIAE